MSYLVFARKYRPQSFDQVVGQDHVTRTLSNAIALGRLPHAVLFAGPRGTGKTTVARILAKSMNCQLGPTATPCNQCRSCKEITAGSAADVFEIDGASNNSVDQIRELRDNLKYMPVYSPHKIYIIDEVHMLSLAAFNALLKTLEEPPLHVLFIFATTEPQKIPITILSRCQRHDLRRIELSAIVDQMLLICEQERMTVDGQSLELIAQESGGSMRDALSLLDHVLSCAQGPITVELVGQLLGVVERRHLFELSAAVLARDIHAVLEKIDTVWRCGFEVKRFFADVVAHFRHMAVAKLGLKTGRSAGHLIDLPDHEIRQIQAQVEQVPDIYLVQILDQLVQAEPSVKLSGQPKLALEMVFLKLFQTPPVLPIDLLIDRLDKLRTAGAPGQASADLCGQDLPPKNFLPRGDRPAVCYKPADPAEPADAVQGAMPIDSLWEKIVQRVSEQKPSLAAHLNKCHLKTLDGNRLVIEVTGNDFVLNSVQKQIQFLGEVCGALLGKAIMVALDANIEDAVVKEEQKKKIGLLKQQALGHPVVLEAIEVFSGKVIDVKVKS